MAPSLQRPRTAGAPEYDAHDLVVDARTGEGLSVRAFASRVEKLANIKLPPSTLSAIENRTRPLEGTRQRVVIHAAASILGERSAVEEEQDAEPLSVVRFSFRGGPVQLATDDRREVPTFGDPALAGRTKLRLAEHPGFDHAYVTPVWASGLTNLLLRLEVGGRDRLEAMSREDREAIAVDFVQRIYMVEARAKSPLEIRELADDLPRRIAQGQEARSLELRQRQVREVGSSERAR